MNKGIIMTLLTIAMISMNVGFIVVTLGRQEEFEIAYNIITITMNIAYYVLELAPVKEQ